MKYFLFFLLVLNSVFACEVQLPYQLIVFNEGSSGKNVIRAQNCDEKFVDELHQVLASLEGRVASFQLSELLLTKGFKADITPNSIQILQFKSLIRDQITLPAGIQVTEANVMNMPSIMALPAGDRIEVSCSSCLFGTQQPINVTIHGFDGGKHSFFANADFKKMVKAYRLITPLPSFSEFQDSSILKEEYVEAIPHTDLVTDFETLKFYKTNKPLKAGDLLRTADLNPVNLVRAGLKTEVVLENHMIRIKTHGISRSNGSIGELVEVFHPQKNKKYLGKVIDINKVYVEL